MKQLLLFFAISLFALTGCGAKWTTERAKEEAFRNVRTKIDVSTYPAKDPDFEENQQALKENKNRVSDRFVTAEPPIGYVVSKLNKEGHAKITFFYKQDGQLIALRLFSTADFPHSAYIYCAANECIEGDLKYQTGELMSVSFHPSDIEVFYFRPDGHLNAHIKD